MNALWLALLVFLAQVLPQPAGSIQGLVSKFDNGEPVSGARLELIRLDGTAPQIYSDTSASNGTFIIRNIRPGSYRLAASGNGYLRREFGQHGRSGIGMALNIEANQGIRDLEIPLRPAAAISGKVVGRDGDLIAAGTVFALVPAYKDGQRILRVVQSTITNDLGEYRLFSLSAGSYYVGASPSGDVPYATLVVSPSLTVPTANAFTGVPRAAGVVYYPSTTDFRIATPVDVRNGGESGGVNITLVPLKPHHIRGNVPGGMAYVSLVPGDPGSTTAAQSIVKVEASNGPFDIPNVFPGEYTLVARSDELLGMASVRLGESDVDGVTIGLTPSVHVPTHVSFEDHPPGGDDPDLENINFNLLAVPPIPGTVPDVYGPFPNGFLAFGVLLRQDYRIATAGDRNATSPRLRDAYIQSIRMGTRDVINDGFRIDDPANILPLDIVLGVKPGALAGTVTSEKQKPQANATVLLVPDAGRRRWADTFRTVHADIAGRYTFDRIPPGDYFVFSWEEVEDDAWMDPDFMKIYESRGQRVHVGEGSRQTLNVTAIPESLPGH